METVFVRYEKKYVLSKIQKDKIVAGFLKHGFDYDIYCPDGKRYDVYTIYYDTKDYAAIRQSQVRMSYREKLRLRFYEYPLTNTSTVFIELKKKLKGKGNKRRLPLKLNDALQFIDQGIEPKLSDPVENQIYKEIDFYIQRYEIKPFTFIKYNRLALYDDATKIRVTFDEHIEYAKIAPLKDHVDFNSLPQAKDLIIMEIKSLANYPLWLSKLLTQEKVYSRGFSKYRNTYETLHEGGMIHVNRT